MRLQKDHSVQTQIEGSVKGRRIQIREVGNIFERGVSFKLLFCWPRKRPYK